MTTATETLIFGLEHGASCDCCGRKLKYGIKSSAHGIIGADCLISKMVPNRARWSLGLPTASMIRDMAKAKEGFGPMRGRLPDHAFRLALKSA